MKDGLYSIKVAAQFENPIPDGVAMLILDGGMVFAELQPVVGKPEDIKEQTEALEKINTSQTMKEQERIFFALCYKLREIMKPRDVVHLLAETIPHKRCWYYLDKWNILGFYSSGVSTDLGWFYPDKLPPRYREIIDKEAAQ